MVLVCVSHLGMHLLYEHCLSHLTLGKCLLSFDISRTLCCARNAEGCYRVSLFLNTSSRNLEKYRQVHPSLIASEQQVFFSNTRPLPLCERVFFWPLRWQYVMQWEISDPRWSFRVLISRFFQQFQHFQHFQHVFR